MSNCKFCHNTLTALNLSDIEPDCCQSCEAKLIARLDTVEEDPEISSLSIPDLDKIITTRFFTPIYLTNKIIQRKVRENTFHTAQQRRINER